MIRGFEWSEILLASLDNLCNDFLFAFNGCESRNDFVYSFSVQSPELVPEHEVSVFGGTLLKHELHKTGDSHSSSQDSLNSWHSRIVPTRDKSNLNDFVQLSFGESRVDKIQSRKVLNFYFS